ncbi:hypothetical protein [Teredinibacter sp. KSP-S5-2]|uniref:hypothetical protein n=1 Tax=Teredinibacter sp. KSP-S5-2 TaxID=3034506 RepID=UPI002934EDBC|nr:hypothetical protein [Teredinibacter sp. KSP-S5-2]WNO10783.1 hypothetical protein P5V12_06295 [Teredinibacter sp. KSP-S5-2]
MLLIFLPSVLHWESILTFVDDELYPRPKGRMHGRIRVKCLQRVSKGEKVAEMDSASEVETVFI